MTDKDMDINMESKKRRVGKNRMSEERSKQSKPEN